MFPPAGMLQVQTGHVPIGDVFPNLQHRSPHAAGWGSTPRSYPRVRGPWPPAPRLTRFQRGRRPGHPLLPTVLFPQGVVIQGVLGRRTKPPCHPGSKQHVAAIPPHPTAMHSGRGRHGPWALPGTARVLPRSARPGVQPTLLGTLCSRALQTALGHSADISPPAAVFAQAPSLGLLGFSPAAVIISVGAAPLASLPHQHEALCPEAHQDPWDPQHPVLSSGHTHGPHVPVPAGSGLPLPATSGPVPQSSCSRYPQLGSCLWPPEWPRSLPLPSPPSMRHPHTHATPQKYLSAGLDTGWDQLPGGCLCCPRPPSWMWLPRATGSSGSLRRVGQGCLLSPCPLCSSQLPPASPCPCCLCPRCQLPCGHCPGSVPSSSSSFSSSSSHPWPQAESWHQLPVPGW